MELEVLRDHWSNAGTDRCLKMRVSCSVCIFVGERQCFESDGAATGSRGRERSSEVEWENFGGHAAAFCFIRRG